MTDHVSNPRSADRLARAARAAHTLSETLWEALLHEELGAARAREDPDARGDRVGDAERIGELSERLVEVAASVALLARMERGAAEPAKPPEPTAVVAGESVTYGEPTAAGESGAADEPGAHGEPVAHEEPPQESFPSREESPPSREGAPRSRKGEELRGQGEGSSQAAAGSTVGVAVLVDELAPREASEIEIRDARRDVRQEESPPRESVRGGEEGPRAWIASIGRRLERYRRDELPFAVLLLELADIERLRHAELPGEMARLTGLIERALAEELRPADSLTRESPGRYWLLTPETDARDIGSLTERLSGAVRGAARHRGTPLEVAIGIATCPTDGSQAAVLAARADIALYAARASGRTVAPVDDPA